MQLGQLPALFCFLFSLRVLASRILRGNNNRQQQQQYHDRQQQCAVAASVPLCVLSFFSFSPLHVAEAVNVEELHELEHEHERTRESPKKNTNKI